LRACAREGQCVEEASEFARWLASSGLVKLFEGSDKVAVNQLIADMICRCWSPAS
jgi:hypothetical protein